MNRLLAVIAAVGLVAGAVLVRTRIDNGDSGGGRDGRLQLVCGTDLAGACQKLVEESGGDVGMSIEDEATTADRLAKGTLQLGDDTVWLAAGPWPEVTAAGEAGDTKMPRLARSAVLGASPAAIVARKDRMAAITEACGKPTWACIGNQAGGNWTGLGGKAEWGTVEVALPTPDDGAGLVAVDQAVASRVGRTNFSINDIDDDPATTEWFDRLAGASNANTRTISVTPLARFLQVPGSLGVVGALESQAVTGLAAVAARDSLTMVVPEPVSQAQVRLWAPGKAAVSGALDRLGRPTLADALLGAGWRVPDRPAPSGAANMEMPDTAGLPSPGTSSAVRTRWESTR